MPGSTSRSIRSRASSLPRERCRSTARSPPPAATCAVRARSSSTSASIRLVAAREVVRPLDPALEQRHGRSLTGVVGAFGHPVRVPRNRLLLLAGAVVAAAVVAVVLIVVVAASELRLGVDQTTTTDGDRRAARGPRRSSTFAGIPQHGDTLGKATRAGDADRLRGPAVPVLPGSGTSTRCRRSSQNYVRTGPRQARLSRHRRDRAEQPRRAARDLRGRAAEQALEHGRGAVRAAGRREQRLDHDRRRSATPRRRSG